MTQKFIIAGGITGLLLSILGFVFYSYFVDGSLQAQSPQSLTVTVYFNNDRLSRNPERCDEVFPVLRKVPHQDSVAYAALDQLIKGPAPAEQQEGYRSFFSTATDSILNTIQVRDNVVYIDFKDIRGVLSGATSSCGQAELISQLESTLRPFYPDQKLLFSIEGDSSLFYNWLELAAP